MNKLRETEEYLRNWLEHFKQVSNAAPAVQQTFEEVTWARQALDGRPPEAANLSTAQIDHWVEAAHVHITSSLPQIPHFDPKTVTQVNSLTTSANNAVSAYIQDVAKLGTSAAIRWATKQIAMYKSLQERYTRSDHVRDLLAKRWPQVLPRFDAAVTAYKRCAINTGSDAAAAVEMRTTLDAVQGELFYKARLTPREKMNWDVMANRLAQDPIRCQVLQAQGLNREALMGYLSNMAKRRPGNKTPMPNIDALWTMWIDHLFLVIT